MAGAKRSSGRCWRPRASSCRARACTSSRGSAGCAAEPESPEVRGDRVELPARDPTYFLSVTPNRQRLSGPSPSKDMTVTAEAADADIVARSQAGDADAFETL